MPPTILEVRRHDELQAVQALWRAERKTLGFLPDEGFEERADRGTLLAAADEGQIVGYVLYDLPGDRVKLVHLCVARDQRSGGIARLLVDELSRRHGDRQRIELACRRDYEVANRAWPKLGFVPAIERPGRSVAGHLLTVWVKDHGHPHLFSEIAEGRELAFLDTNIIIDWAVRSTQSWSWRLREDWLAEYVDFAICDEVPIAIHRRADDTERARSHAAAREVRLVPVAEGEWKPLLSGLEEILPTAQPEDHRSLAKALAAEAAYFVTHDDALNRAADRLRVSFGIEVTRSEWLIRRIDRLRSGERYEPSALQGTSIVEADASTVSERHLVQAFQNFAGGERKPAFRQLLQQALAQPERITTHVLLDSADRPIGLWAREVRGCQLHVPLLRAGFSGPVKDAVARQMAFLPRQHAADQGLSEVLISDPAPSDAIRKALPAEAYEPIQGGWRARLGRGLREASEVMPELRGHALTQHAIRYEQERWPVKLIGAGIRSYLMPIKLAFAEQLFEAVLAEQTLFSRPPTLGLSREHVYYRKPANHRGIDVGCRILWYVTGHGAGGKQESQLRAVSQVRKVSVGSPESLFKRNAQLGVWSAAKVKAAADRKGRVMAIRFGDTELLTDPLGLGELRSLYAEQGLSFHAPLSPQAVPEHMFCLMYARASAYAAA
jgi:ribosomal protein S18 acetylase RimI-like enzyme/predicted nucleic acid-binding protein